jgi:hypothetical protein
MITTTMRKLLLAALLVHVLPAQIRAEQPGAAIEDLPQYRVADEAAAVVTSTNLLASERFWPYRVSLTEGFLPAGREKPLKAGDVGVLIRVDDSSAARIDFGRDGIFEVPVSKTDLVESANRIRRGEALKKAPNFTLAIGPRLVSSDAPTLVPLLLRKTLDYRGFLTVFADPDSDVFPQIAAELAPLRAREGVLTILFPLSTKSDPMIRDRLRALEWPIAFVYDHLSESYLASLLPGGTKPPFVMLQTREGRVLFQGPWTPSVAAELRTVLDRDLPKAPIATPPQSNEGTTSSSTEGSGEGAANRGANQTGDDSKP